MSMLFSLHASPWKVPDNVLDVYNKVDAISLEHMDKLARQDHTFVISCELDLK